MAEALGLSKSTVQRIWRQARLQPHRLDLYMSSNDPQFEEKAADIIALYMKPPQHAAVFFVDEKSAIQEDRLDPVLPMSPGRAERHGFIAMERSPLYAALKGQQKMFDRWMKASVTEEELGEYCSPSRSSSTRHRSHAGGAACRRRSAG